jgi:hypothetical protein
MRSLKQAAIGSVARSASLSSSGPFAGSLVTGKLRESFTGFGSLGFVSGLTAMGFFGSGFASSVFTSSSVRFFVSASLSLRGSG